MADTGAKPVHPVQDAEGMREQVRTLKKELAAVDASMDPGRPMKMEKLEAQIAELHSLAAERASRLAARAAGEVLW